MKQFDKITTLNVFKYEEHSYFTSAVLNGKYYIAVARNGHVLKEIHEAKEYFNGISPAKYLRVLHKHNVRIYKKHYFFKNKQDAKNALEELKPFVILATLTQRTVQND